ncbi:hypothetical protein DdX_06667 [Ditylenchus destructor]|uniref:Uncharacterized protein n=1 Tax=Ditylenchus destructor TaxID=166010 RepID=A0AAD4N7J8_9BILA|nr:hypothetical protein DdX_06667 [Ditylenchus destructor]
MENRILRANSVVYPDLIRHRDVPNFLSRSFSVPDVPGTCGRTCSVSIAPYHYSNIPMVRYRSNWPCFYPNYRSSWTSRYYKYLYDYDYTPLLTYRNYYPPDYYGRYRPYRRFYDYPYTSAYLPYRPLLLGIY